MKYCDLETALGTKMNKNLNEKKKTKYKIKYHSSKSNIRLTVRAFRL